MPCQDNAKFDAKIDELFLKFDTNNDGKLSREEMKLFFK